MADSDKRRHARERVLRRAVILDDAGRGSFSCLIVDISASGARVQLLGEAPPEGPMTLMDARSGRLYGGRIVWRRGKFAGVSFTSTHSVESLRPAGTHQQTRVLVVDDDETNRLVLERVLNRLQPSIRFAVDGAEATEAFEQEAFDVVLMDLRMPRMDGFEAIRRMRALELDRGSSRTPILVVSAHSDPEHVAEARSAGADDHIGKPINVKRLLDAIGQRVRPAAP